MMAVAAGLVLTTLLTVTSVAHVRDASKRPFAQSAAGTRQETGRRSIDALVETVIRVADANPTSEPISQASSINANTREQFDKQRTAAGADGAAPTVGARAGVMACEGTEVRARWAFPGSTFETQSVNNLTECCEMCGANKICTHWTYRGADGTCRLKQAQGRAFEATPWDKGTPASDPGDVDTFSGRRVVFTSRVINPDEMWMRWPPHKGMLDLPSVDKANVVQLPPGMYDGNGSAMTDRCRRYFQSKHVEPQPNIIPHVVYQTGPELHRNRTGNNNKNFNFRFFPPDTEWHFFNYDETEASMRNLSALLAAEGVVEGAWEAFQSIVPFAFRADMWRAAIIWANGGIYLDDKMRLTYEGPTLFVNSDAFVNTARLHTHVPLERSWYDSY